MSGLYHHLVLTLRLNFRSMQAIVYGYLVPIFFLVAFGTLFRSGNPPLVHEIGQLLTITILGGACFGMPTAMVAERERGVWRRYRLLPAGMAAIVTSTMFARLVLLASAVLLQLVLARIVYGTTPPAHPLGMLVTFVFVSFAFLGMGLVIAMVANTVPAVQALGQAIFLPMIIIGGVGVPLRVLSPWAQHVAAFLPGRYAVQALQACEDGRGLRESWFEILALSGIGVAACIAGTKLFRWDVGQRNPPGTRRWVALAVLTWAGVGLAAHATGRLRGVQQAPSGDVRLIASIRPAQIVATRPVTTATARVVQAWQEMTRAQTDAITYDDLPDDAGTIVPVATDLDNLTDDQYKRLKSILAAIDDWPPAKSSDPGQRVRYMLSICALYDLFPDELEAPIAFAAFQRLQEQMPHEQLVQVLTWIALRLNEGKVLTSLGDFGIDFHDDEPEVRERTSMYARKLLMRVLHKKPQP